MDRYYEAVVIINGVEESEEHDTYEQARQALFEMRRGNVCEYAAVIEWRNGEQVREYEFTTR